MIFSFLVRISSFHFPLQTGKYHSSKEKGNEAISFMSMLAQTRISNLPSHFGDSFLKQRTNTRKPDQSRGFSSDNRELMSQSPRLRGSKVIRAKSCRDFPPISARDIPKREIGEQHNVNNHSTLSSFFSSRLTLCFFVTVQGVWSFLVLSVVRGWIVFQFCWHLNYPFTSASGILLFCSVSVCRRLLQEISFLQHAAARTELPKV